MSIKKEPITWYVVIGCFVAVFVQITLLIVSGPSFLLGTDESEDADRKSDPSSAEPDAATADEPTPYLREIATELQSDPVWIDPLVAGSTGEAWIDGRVRAAVRDSETPVFVAVIAPGRSDGSDGDLTLAVARLAAAMDREGVYYVITADRVQIFESLTDSEVRPEPNFFVSASTAELATSVESIDDAASEGSSSSGASGQVSMGIFLGVPWLVVGWFVSRWIARAARRNTNYMEGFG